MIHSFCNILENKSVKYVNERKRTKFIIIQCQSDDKRLKYFKNPKIAKEIIINSLKRKIHFQSYISRRS